MSCIQNEIAQLTKQKQELEHQTKSIYAEMDNIFNELHESFKKLYPDFSRFEDYEIVSVDFWFGDIACEYNGKNYNLSNKLFGQTNAVSDISVFNLTLRQLIRIHNTLVLLYSDVFEIDDIPQIEKSTITTNEIIDQIRVIASRFNKCKNSPDKANEKLAHAVQRLYVLLDFGLYQDGDIHEYLRNLHSKYIEFTSNGYDKISSLRDKIDIIDEQIRINQKSIPIPQIQTKTPKSSPKAEKSLDYNTSFLEKVKALPQKLTFCIIASIVIAALFFIGIADLPIGYYTFLRIFSLITLAASIIAYALQTDNLLNPITYTQAPIAILFNPLAPIYLDKEIWIVFDIICGIAMLAIAVYIYKSYTSKHKN